jgi:hypothetical protein
MNGACEYDCAGAAAADGCLLARGELSSVGQFYLRDKPVIFAFHAYPRLIHRPTYRRTNHDNFHVRRASALYQ